MSDLHFVPEDAIVGEMLAALDARTELAACFIVKVKDGEVMPFGLALCTKKQCIIPAAGRYEFK